ncbi:MULTISPECIES: site-specific integrase [Anaerolinea]|uniref:Site-specific recombinase n=1 Tax=Anaerolinea thermophila (strain DSM 14523 / JCM 11388 / NBRC 100420 / UNI-1) TaxID=926569 RepID=E8MYS0_ANATU|nr:MULTISPECIES: tyrosine-type recombinase/integrase [Anaerolinea]BAJ64406.1 putative site-specific recombinase [Anaerolinea thermophila UNI-1]GAP07444.1 site-specific recombinase XerD [Anaerolinea thermolimosa]
MITNKTPTVKELVDVFLESQKGFISDSTLRWYVFYLRPLVAHLGDRETNSITTSDLINLFHLMRTDDREPYTLFNFIRGWKRLFRWAVDEGYIAMNPAKKLRRPPLPQKSPAGIQAEDLSKMLDAASKTGTPERDLALVLFVADTGVRLGGVAGLTVDRLDINKRRAIVLEKGRGGQKERVVFFSSRTAIALENWLEKRGETEDQRVFLLKPNGIYQLFKRLARKSEITGKWNPHSFRHAYARKLLAEGVSIGIVSHLMGHSNVQVTIDFYGRFSHDELQEIYDKIMN